MKTTKFWCNYGASATVTVKFTFKERRQKVFSENFVSDLWHHIKLETQGVRPHMPSLPTPMTLHGVSIAVFLDSSNSLC